MITGPRAYGLAKDELEEDSPVFSHKEIKEFRFILLLGGQGFQELSHDHLPFSHLISF